ncbi:MAG: BTAD domain-containing putative transcriptional regulator, partial [Chloroflexota bacterium]
MHVNPDTTEEITLRIYLFGGFRVVVQGRPVNDADWRVRKAKALVKMLALERGHSLHRDHILEGLWPDMDPQAGANNLHKTLYTARRALNPSSPIGGGFLRLQGDMLTLTSPDGVWVDVEAFETAAAAARQTQTIDAYRSALDLYAGDLLPEDRYEDWVAPRREEVQSTYLELLMEFSRLYEAAEQWSGAIEQLGRVIAVDPVHEQAHAGLMRLYALSGQRHQALRQYQRLQEALQRELEIEPTPETQELYRDIAEGRVHAAHSVATAPSPDPAPTPGHREFAAPIVGRDQELEWLEDVLDRLFAGEGDVILIGGEAGVGKSRLALEIADRVAHRGGVSLMGAAYEQEQQLPYGPFVEALEDFRGQRAPQEEQRLFAEPGAEVLHYLSGGRSLQQPGLESPQPDPLDQQQLFR